MKFKSAKEMGFYDPKADQKDAEVTISARKLKDLRDERDAYREALESLASYQFSVGDKTGALVGQHCKDVLARFEKTVRKE